MPKPEYYNNSFVFLKYIIFPIFDGLEDQLHAVDSLIDSMSLVYEDEREETVEDIFKNSKFPNPQFQRLFQVS